MIIANKEYIPLFPTPLLKIELPSSLSKIVPYLNSLPLIDEDGQEHNYGLRSKDTYILNNPECENLKEYILNCVSYFSLNYMNWKPNLEFQFTQSWISIKYQGQSHVPHTHNNSLISGVFYYGEVDNNTPGIEFKDTFSLPKINTISFPFENIELQNQSLSTLLPTPPGIMYLFPSWLVHSVPANQSSLPRKSLAFNTVTKGGFGEDESLTRLKF